MCAAVDNADMPEAVRIDEKLLREHIKSGNNTEALSLLDDANLCRFLAKHKSTILHLAAEYGNKDLAQKLVDLGANVDAQNNIGETPLIIAVKHEHKNVIEILLKANADIFIRDIFGKSALARAFDDMEGLREDVRRLILHSVTIDFVLAREFWDDIPFYHAPLLNNVELTKILLNKGSQIDATHEMTGRTALHEAVRLLDVDNVKLLLKYRANVNARDELNQTPIYFIPEYNDDDDTVEIVRMLIEAGASLMDFDDTFSPMKNMLSRGGPKIVRTVLESQRIVVFSSLNLFVTDRFEILMDLLFGNENPAVYQELRNFDIDFQMRFDDNSTLLHRAVRKGNPIAVKFLIDRLVNVNAKNNDNLTPLHMIIDPVINAGKKSTNLRYGKCHIDIINVLLRNGADPQIFTSNIDCNRISVYKFEKLDERVADELMKPVLMQLALQEAEGRVIDEFMLYQIQWRKSFDEIFEKCRRELQTMKRVKLDVSVTLLDFLVDKRVRMFAENKEVVENLTDVMDGYYAGSHYYEMLKNRVWEVERLYVINEVFVQVYNVSAMGIAEKIVEYLNVAVRINDFISVKKDRCLLNSAQIRDYLYDDNEID